MKAETRVRAMKTVADLNGIPEGRRAHGQARAVDHHVDREQTAMTAGPDFDFKIGQSHFRGRGGRALIALAIVRWRWPVLLLGGTLAAWMPPWVWELVHRYVGWVW